MHHSSGLHHAEKIAKEGRASFFDRFMIVVGLIGPLALLPQVVAVWVSQDVSGVSALSWALLMLGSLAWVAYGIFRKLPALIFGNALLALFNALVVIGVLRR